MNKVFGCIFMVCGAAFVSVCIYYERERSRNPSYKKRLRDKRAHLKKEQLPYYEIAPTTIDPQFREAMIINEIQVAEKLMLREKWEEAIIHFAHAITVCADPAHLLNCLHQTLPPPTYEMLIKTLSSMYDGRLDSGNDRPRQRNQHLTVVQYK